MNLVRIRGPESVVAGLRDILGLTIAEHSGIALDTGDVQLSGYASDDAIAEIQSRGATVEVIMDAAALGAQEDELFTIIDSQGPVA